MQEKTLVILKPDALKRGLAGEIVSRIERAGLTLAAAQLESPSAEKLDRHYRVEILAPIIGKKSRDAGTDVGNDVAAYGRMVLGWNREYMMDGPVLVMVWQGENAIKRVRQLVGATDPQNAAPGTIRGDFGVDSIAKANAERRGTANMVHASDKVAVPERQYEEADYEISLWFPALKLENKHGN